MRNSSKQSCASVPSDQDKAAYAANLSPSRIAAVALLTAICFLLATAEARACSCGDLPSPAVAVAQSAKVFSGKVVHVSGGDGTRREPALLSGYVTVEFEVYAVWKGPAYATMFIETAWWSGSCGVEFYLGQEWLVYSYDGETAHPCGRTKRLSLAQADLDQLGAGQAPSPGTVEPQLQAPDRVERIRTQDSVPSAAMPAAEARNEGESAWLFLLQLGVILALAALAAAIFGRTYGNRVGSASGNPFRAIMKLAGLLRGRNRQ